MAAFSREHLRGQNLLTVASFFWLDPARQRQYQIAPDDVRIWDNMVARPLPLPPPPACVTHRPRVLLMDIDMVAVDCLDPIVMRDEHAVWWKNPNYEPGGRRGFIQGSMQLFTVGATTHLWEDFNPRRTPAMLNRRFGGGEQAWISERLNTAWPEPGWEWDVPHWTEADGVYGAGRLVNGKMGEGVQSELPENARIVFTPGDRSPSQPEMVARHPWIRHFYK